MSRFLESQLDYLLLIYGLGFIVLGCVALFGLPRTATRLPWRWLGFFGVVNGINEWLEMLALSLPDPPAFRAIRLAVMAVSFLALFEFGRRSLRAYGKGCLGTWVYLPLLALAGMGGFAGMSGLDAACRYAFAFPGAVLTALALWREGKRCEERSLGGPLIHSAALMAVYAAAAGLITPRAAFFPASVLSHDTFYSSAGFPIQLVRGICALLMACAVWRFDEAAQARSLRLPVKDARGRGTALVAGIMAMTLAAGWAFTHWTGMRADADMRSRIVAQARIAAKAIGLSEVRGLTGTPEDLRSPDYVLLKGQLASIRTADPAYRFLYLVGVRDGTCFFFVDSESPASKDYSPPGQTYEEASRTLLNVFAEGHAAAEGPAPDRWGTWVSALVPITDPDSGRVLAVLGTDIDAAMWAAAVARERLEPIAITMLLLLIVVGVFAGYQRRLHYAAQLYTRARELAASEARYRSVVDNMQDGLYRTDAEGMVVMASRSAANLLGFDSVDEMLGREGSSLWMHPEERSKLTAHLKEHGSVSEYEVVLKRRDGSALPASANVQLLRAEDGAFLGHEGVFRDITERKRAEEALRESQERYRVISEGSPHGILMADRKTRKFVYANPCICRLLGYTEKELLQLGVADIHPKDSLGHVASEFESQARGEKTLASELPCLRKDGTVFYADVTSSLVILDPVGGQECLVGFFADVTERKRAEEALRESQERYRVISEGSPHGILMADSRTRQFVYANPCMCRLLGYTEKELLQLGVADIHPKDSLGHVASDFESQARGEATLASELPCLRKDGTVFYADVTAAPITLDGGQACNVGFFADVTERKRAEEGLLQARAELERLNAELEQALVLAKQSTALADRARGDAEDKARVLDYASSHDSLTALPNRQYFTARVQEHCEQAAAGKSVSFTVMFLDLDQFKLINDTLGHNLGDLVLVEVAARLRSCVRSEDMLARMGGDEFTVILRGRRSRSAVESVAARILGSISRPFEIEGHRLVIGASIGLAVCPADGTDATTLLRHADAAMYKAKQAGRGTFRWYAGGTDTDDLGRLDLEGNLQSALDENQLRVYYQPIISLRDGSLYGAEALLRWEHPQRGMISPSVFIPVAEETGLITPIGDYALRTACAQAKAWIDEGMPLSVIGVNVSIVQIRDDTWLNRVKAALSDTGLDAERLSLELTETALASDPHFLAPLLRKIRGLGVGVAIDDFGMGHSSLSRLKNLPVSYLKDGSFVRDTKDDDSGKAMLASIIEMAHNLGMKAIAEWVETKAQVESLRSSGCDFAQGYFFSPPLPADRFRAFALERTAPVSRKRRAAVVKAG